MSTIPWNYRRRAKSIRERALHFTETPTTMAKKKKAFNVIIYRTKHKSQPWRVDMDDPGGGPIVSLQERYVSAWSAKRGALRKIDATTSGGSPGKPWGYGGGYCWYTPKGQIIEFTKVGGK